VRTRSRNLKKPFAFCWDAVNRPIICHQIYSRANTRAPKPTSTHTHTHAHTATHAQTHTHAHRHTYIHRHTHIHVLWLGKATNLLIATPITFLISTCFIVYATIHCMNRICIYNVKLCNRIFIQIIESYSFLLKQANRDHP